MKMTEPYSPSRASEGQREAGEQRRQDRRQDHPRERLEGAGAQRRRRLFDLGVEVLQHRLHRAHDERQADEDQCHHDAERGVRDLDAERLQQAAEPAVAGPDRGQRDAGDRGRQRERQVDQRVDQPLAGEAVAHQHPGDDQAEDGVDRGAASAVAKLTRKAASTRGEASVGQISPPAPAALTTSAPSGISTTSPR